MNFIRQVKMEKIFIILIAFILIFALIVAFIYKKSKNNNPERAMFVYSEINFFKIDI